MHLGVGIPASKYTKHKRIYWKIVLFSLENITGMRQTEARAGDLSTTSLKLDSH